MENDKLKIAEKLFELAKNRKIHPAGKSDPHRWYPAYLLERSMYSVREPSRAFPWSYMTHCRTKKFIIKFITDNEINDIDSAIELYTKG